MPNSQSIWNALLTVLGVALMAVIGWQMSEISKLKEEAAADNVSEFTEQEANELRQELTTALTDIDMRLRLIERDIEWIKYLPGTIVPPGTGLDEDLPDPVPPAPLADTPNMMGDGSDAPEAQAPAPQIPQGLKYDLRK